MILSKLSFFFLCFALFLLIFTSVRLAPPDQAFYYSFAQSLLSDLDFAFANQYSQFPFADHETYLTKQGYPANDWPMGTGICWLPFLALAHFVRMVGGYIGILSDTSSFEWLEKWIVTLGASLLYGGGTVWLSYRYCRNEGIGHSDALWATALMALGSTFTYHLYVNSADSHPPSAFFIALFLILWQSYRKNPSWRQAFLTGAAIGMAGLIRPHNLIFLIVPFLEIILGHVNQPSFRQAVINLGVLITTAFFVFFPQAIVWKTLYGSWLAIPRSGDVFWTQPELYKTLFSDYHGMISWSPLFGLGIIGLFTSKRWLPLLVPVLIQIYIYSCNLAWWSGGSFGNRRMVGCVPLLVLGLAVLFDTVPKRWIKGLAVVCALWTLALLLAEVGGTIRLDRYQPWKEICDMIPIGLIPGLINHITNARWNQHAIARITGFIVVLSAFTTVYIFLSKTSTIRRNIHGMVTISILALNVLCVAAAWRSPSANREADREGYLKWDRFTWVVYYEKGWYLVGQSQTEKALECFLAAMIAEPRHPEAWNYAALLCDRNHWPILAYHLGCAAFAKGHRSSQFLRVFDENILTRQIERNDIDLYLYHNQRGVVRAIRQNYALAEADFNRSLSLKPDYLPAKLNLQIIEDLKKGIPTPLKWQ